MKTVNYFNKATGTTYVYEVLENYWDKDKKQSRSKRRLIGKLDPETGEIIPTVKKKKEASASPDYKSLYQNALNEIASKDEQISSLQSQLKQKSDLLSNIENLILSSNHS